MMDENALVTPAALAPVVHGFRWDADGHLDILIAEEHDTPGHWITLGRHRRTPHMSHAHHVSFDIFGLRCIDGLPASHLGRRVNVVKSGRWAGESLRTEDLFAVEPAVWPSELDMPLRWDRAEFRVERHAIRSVRSL